VVDLMAFVVELEEDVVVVVVYSSDYVEAQFVVDLLVFVGVKDEIQTVVDL
jgi:hypothetical protein